MVAGKILQKSWRPQGYFIWSACVKQKWRASSQGWEAAFEGDLERSVDVATDKSSLSSRIFSGVISKIITAFHNMLQSP